MLATHATPHDLRTATVNAVNGGAWAASDVVASVTAALPAAGPDVIATLWDLVADGVVDYDHRNALAPFRPQGR